MNGLPLVLRHRCWEKHVAVEIVSWNPRRAVFAGRIGRRLPIKRPVNNFGDLLGPLVVGRLLQRAGLPLGRPPFDNRLLSIGSILALARSGDVIWGSGVNGKISSDRHVFEDLDVRAVRGPRTREFLQARGVLVPEVYGDPGLLLPEVMPQLRDWATSKRHAVTIVPNLNDWRQQQASRDVMNPRDPLERCLQRVAMSEFVVGSSLHAIVIAESLGIPARLVRSPVEHMLKYADYYEGTGRPVFQAAETVAEAMELGGERALDWSSRPLLDAFPYDLWRV